jgi:hypothetical protein
VGSNLSLRNTFFRQAETDFSEPPIESNRAKINGFSETAPDWLLNPDDIKVLEELSLLQIATKKGYHFRKDMVCQFLNGMVCPPAQWFDTRTSNFFKFFFR